MLRRFSTVLLLMVLVWPVRTWPSQHVMDKIDENEQPSEETEWILSMSKKHLPKKVKIKLPGPVSVKTNKKSDYTDAGLNQDFKGRGKTSVSENVPDLTLNTNKAQENILDFFPDLTVNLNDAQGKADIVKREVLYPDMNLARHARKFRNSNRHVRWWPIRVNRDEKGKDNIKYQRSQRSQKAPSGLERSIDDPLDTVVHNPSDLQAEAGSDDYF